MVILCSGRLPSCRLRIRVFGPVRSGKEEATGETNFGTYRWSWMRTWTSRYRPIIEVTSVANPAVRWLSFLFTALLLCTLLAFPTSAARTVVIDTTALFVEGIDDAQIVTMPEFTAESEEYTVSGASGRFDSSAEIFVAWGSADRPASLQRLGESPFSVTALERITIAFQDETFEALGGVIYSGEEIHATGTMMVVDRRDRLTQLIEELFASVSDAATRELVLGFFEKITDDARLVLMRGDVQVEREDSSLQAEWVVFSEDNEEEFISVSAPDKPLRVSFVIADDDDESGEEGASTRESPEAPAE